MGMRATALPQHFFISYSRDDETYVARLKRRFEANGIPVWIDTRDVVPGSQNWERSVRQALDVSFALILVASPRAAKSEYVQTELALAKDKGLSTIPIWVTGNRWLECVPLSAGHIQHIDLRSAKFPLGVKVLVRHLLQVIAQKKPRHALVRNPFAKTRRSPGLRQYVSIFPNESDDRKLAAFDPGAFDSLQNLLGELHANYLAHKFPPLSYGHRWVLQDRTQRGQFVAPQRILAPWAWLQRPLKPISRTAPGWGREPLAAYGLTSESVFVVVEPDLPNRFGRSLRQNAFGLALNNSELLAEVLYGPGKQPWPAYRAGYLKLAPVAAIEPTRFAHTVVVEDPWAGHELAGNVLTETRKRFDLKSFEKAHAGPRRRLHR
ncbi:MAG: TIR domain-containing protein [Alphaproteobacteria bacterium]|nr:TIR domain-containing protein [Alphaproteobacteria bacterium]